MQVSNFITIVLSLVTGICVLFLHFINKNIDSAKELFKILAEQNKTRHDELRKDFKACQNHCEQCRRDCLNRRGKA